MADSQTKFDAAVHVIQSLPKSGSFQPSHEMMLKFYGYYKQAKEGPCTDAKPSFWDVVRKAKWEAWSKLGDTSKEEAMESYVNELKEIIQNMPETDQASQFITALEPFYKVAYVKEEKPPPIFSIFSKEHNIAASSKMNGHASPIKENGDEHTLNTSHASALHNINGHKELNKVKPDPFNEDVTNHADSIHAVNEHSERTDLQSDCNKEGNQSNGNKDSNEDDDDDDDDLFCDSLGPELMEEQIAQAQIYSGMLESVPEEMVPLNDRNLSSFSDVEILEQFDLKKNGGSGGESGSSHSDKMVHVHFEDINASQGEDTITHEEVLREHANKECVVQPNKLGTSGADGRGLLRATGSSGKQAQRNVQYSDRSGHRYGQRYRRRSQESDSDESPGRSDHNSSSERDDAAIDKIADLLMEIQDNMKKILERLKKLETSLQQKSPSTSWLENYRPSKTFVFLILWPFIVNFLIKFLKRRFLKKR
mgnify:FL=1